MTERIARVETTDNGKLIREMEGQLRSLIEFLGVEWSDEVLDHESTAQRRGRIKTASYAQVVEPLARETGHPAVLVHRAPQQAPQRLDLLRHRLVQGYGEGHERVCGPQIGARLVRILPRKRQPLADLGQELRDRGSIKGRHGEMNAAPGVSVRRRGARLASQCRRAGHPTSDKRPFC